MEQREFREDVQMNVVANLKETLEELRLLTDELLKIASDLNDDTLMDRLQKRKALIVRADELRQEIQHMSFSHNNRAAAWNDIEPLLRAIQQADESLVARVREMKEHVGNILSSLYRQQNQGHNYHGGYHGNQ